MTITTDFVRLNALLTKTVPSYAATQAATSTASLNSLFQDLYGNSTAANTQAAIQIAANLGLTGELADIAQVYIATQLNAASYADRGDVLAILASYLAETPAGNAYKGTADAFNTAVTAAEAQATTEGFTGGTFSIVPVTPPNVGEVFRLTANPEDELQGTSRDDTFLARSIHIDTTDEIDGGAGFDRFLIDVTGDIAGGIEVKNVEESIFTILTTATPVISLQNFDETKAIFNRAASGFSSEVTIGDAGENVIVAGTGILTLNVDNNDEALIDTGNATELNLGVSAQGNDLFFKASANVAVADLGGAATDSTATEITVTSDTGARIDVIGLGSIVLEDVFINGNAVLRLGVDQLAAGAEVVGTGILDINVVGAGTLDAEDIFTVIRVTANGALTVDNAEGKTVQLAGVAAGDVTFATSGSSRGSESVTVNVLTNDHAITVDGTELDTLFVNATPTSGTTLRLGAMVVDSDVVLNTGANTVTFSAANGTATAVTGFDDSAAMEVLGSGRFVMNNMDSLATLDGSGYTGSMQITNSGTTAAATKEIRTGSGSDLIIQDAAGSAANIFSGAGNDIVDLSRQQTVNVSVFLGDGDDVVILGTNAALWAGNADRAIINGGEGVDTVVINVSGGDLDNAGGGVDLRLSSVEVIDIVSSTSATAEVALTENALNNQTTLIKGAPTAVTSVLVDVSATGRVLNFSGITFDKALNSFEVDLSVVTISTTAPTGPTAILTGLDDVVTGYGYDGAVQFNLDLGAGDDEITLSDNGGGEGVGGVLTLGPGKDKVIITAASTDADGGATADLVRIADFTEEDTIGFATALSYSIGPNTVTPVDVSIADIQALSTDILATVRFGMVTLSGADAARIDSLTEWMLVVDELADGVYGFEFGGDTYVSAVNLGAPVETIQLTGVTGKVLGAGGVGVIALDMAA